MPRCEMCGEWPDCPWKTDPEIMCGEYHPKPMTNADRIRAMSDEELADLYMKAIEDEEYPGWWGNRMGLLAWLKQEAGE